MIGYTITNTELIAKILDGRATPTDRRLYVRRVKLRREADRCQHRHLDCALMDEGPCHLDVSEGG